MDQVPAPRQRESMANKVRRCKKGYLAEGSKVGTGGRVAKMMVAITHGGGVGICERHEKMDAKYFASFVDQHFNTMFEIQFTHF